MIETTPFVNPFRNLVKKVDEGAKVMFHKGQVYEQVVKKKCQPKT